MLTAFLVERNKGNRELVFAWICRENIYAVLLRRPICESEFSLELRTISIFQQYSLTGELYNVVHWYNQCRTDATHMCNVRMNILTNVCKLEYSNLTNKRIVLCVRYNEYSKTLYTHFEWINFVELCILLDWIRLKSTLKMVIVAMKICGWDMLLNGV